MLRFNKGKKFVLNQLRVVKVQSEEAFERVMIELMWQICSWLQFHNCRKGATAFFQQVFRFREVIPNYFMALCARLVASSELYKAQSVRKWEEVID